MAPTCPSQVVSLLAGGSPAGEAGFVRRRVSSKESVLQRRLSMKLIKNLGMLSLSFYLILIALRNLLGIGSTYRHLNWLIDILALAAGVLILWTVLVLWKGKTPAA